MQVDGSGPKERLLTSANSDTGSLIAQCGYCDEGLSDDRVAESRSKFGSNELASHNRFAALKRLYHSFANLFILSLLAVDLFWLFLDLDIAYFIILTTLIVISGMTTFLLETKSSKAASQLVGMVTSTVHVRRNGVDTAIDSKELVVGDIIFLDAGNTVPADVRILKEKHLRVDQSSLTGESGGVEKHSDTLTGETNILECNNLAFMGTNILGGSAEALVLAVGKDTIFGSMTDHLGIGSFKSSTTYDKGTKEIVLVLLKILFVMVPPVFTIMLIKEFMNSGTIGYETLLEACILSISLAIGLMPIMLSTVVSTNLVKGSLTMAKKKVIVKDVRSIQNFGSMDVFCSDKTGTLTMNRISITECVDIRGGPSRSVGLYAYLNSRNLSSSKNEIDSAIEEIGQKDFRSELDAYSQIDDIPFDFIRRRATVIVGNDGGDNLMITKGAISEVVGISDRYLDADGQIHDMDDVSIKQLMESAEAYSMKGLRILALAYRHFPSTKKQYDTSDETGLVFMGFVIFTDPVKETAKDALDSMKEYGIAVKILTGDNEHVSAHVCKELGIPTDTILIGDQIDRMSDDELRVSVETTDVFARLTPDNKSRIVLALRENGHTVGLMGDGINDVMAMQNADVSISVDTGTEVAKESADMILLEKDLNILKDGAIEGRKVYVNSIKYVKMIGTVTLGYMISLVTASLIFNFEPMGPLMILIFDIVNNVSCLFIAWDNVEDEFVKEPRKWDAPNLMTIMLRYAPAIYLTDLITWSFMIFVVFANMPDFLAADGTYINGMEAILTMKDMGETPFETLFASIWFIEQFWMQVWVIHIVRTNKIPFLETWSAKCLVATSLIALVLGTTLPFVTEFWSSISGISASAMIPIPLYVMLWMPFIACLFLALSHMVKKRTLKKYGYFAC